jgi:hypothetical protein
LREAKDGSRRPSRFLVKATCQLRPAIGHFGSQGAIEKAISVKFPH